MVNKKLGVSAVEIAMMAVVIAIVSVVALPQMFMQSQDDTQQPSLDASIEKVRAAYAIAIANKNDFPSIAEIVTFIDADFAVEMNDRSGIIFRDNGRRIIVNTFNDVDCIKLTSSVEPGVTDIVRCIHENRGF